MGGNVVKKRSYKKGRFKINGEAILDEDIFNMQLRKFLKNVGITSQREIETAVRAAIADGRLAADGSVQARVTLSIEALGVSTDIDGDIALS